MQQKKQLVIKTVSTRHLILMAGFIVLLLLTLFTGKSTRAVPGGQVMGEGGNRFIAKWVASVSGPAVCGNGIVEAGEQCDDGNNINTDGCRNDCTKPPPVTVCGNGIVEAGEQCDDGNNINTDGCRNDCTKPPPVTVCGNGIVEAGEQCDDGNTVSGDGCSSLCRDETVTPRPPVVSFSCPAPGSLGTVRWSSVSGAMSYNVRVDNITLSPSYSNCVSPLAGDHCADGRTGTSYAFSTIAGHTYDVWVYAMNSAGSSNASNIVRGSCANPSFTMRAIGGIEVNFSPALTSNSTQTTIIVDPSGGFSEEVTFTVTDILKGSEGPSLGPKGISGFNPTFIPNSLPYPYTDGSQFSVTVSAEAADPNKDQIYTIVVRGISNAKSATVNVPLVLKASNPGFEEQ